MAIETAPVIASRFARQRLVWVVAAHARQGLAARLNAGAPGEIDGLVPDIPRIAPIDHFPGRRRWAVASSTKLEQFAAPQSARIADCRARQLQVAGTDCPDMLAARAMAGLATNPKLARLQRESVSERQRPGGVALETAHDGRLGAECLVVHTQGVLDVTSRNVAMPRRRPQGISRRVVAEVVLDIPVLVRMADEGDSLLSGPERPLEPQAEPLPAHRDLRVEAGAVSAI